MASGLAVHTSELAKLEYSNDFGSNWSELPGVTGYSESGGERPERDVVGFGGVTKVTGLPRVPTVEINAVYPPLHAAWKKMRRAMEKGDEPTFRITTKERLTFAVTTAGNTVEVTVTTGLLAFAGSRKPDFKTARYAPGQVLVIGTTKYVIDRISGDDPPKAYVKKLDGTAAAAKAATINYKILTPGLQRSFPAAVRLTDRGSLDSESQLTTTLSLSPTGELPDWEIAA